MGSQNKGTVGDETQTHHWPPKSLSNGEKVKINCCKTQGQINQSASQTHWCLHQSKKNVDKGHAIFNYILHDTFSEGDMILIGMTYPAKSENNCCSL